MFKEIYMKFILDCLDIKPKIAHQTHNNTFSKQIFIAQINSLCVWKFSTIDRFFILVHIFMILRVVSFTLTDTCDAYADKISTTFCRIALEISMQSAICQSAKKLIIWLCKVIHSYHFVAIFS